MHVRDQVVPVLGLLQTPERHLGTRNILLGVLQILILSQQLETKGNQGPIFMDGRTKVSSAHLMPLALFASVYVKPST